MAKPWWYYLDEVCMRVHMCNCSKESHRVLCPARPTGTASAVSGHSAQLIFRKFIVLEHLMWTDRRVKAVGVPHKTADREAETYEGKDFVGKIIAFTALINI